ncbi:hypothetical protein MNV49_004508 [Pseudohyphozyma bogoriensis]|nr:hypothetical protein MNV49_004508 [Pseudohyphozyma bogoriensis]
MDVALKSRHKGQSAPPRPSPLDIPELLLKILDFASHDLVGPNLRHFLRSCSLVSRSWVAPSQSHLWERIEDLTSSQIKLLLKSGVVGVYRTRWVTVTGSAGPAAVRLLEVLVGVESLVVSCAKERLGRRNLPAIFQIKSLAGLRGLALVDCTFHYDPKLYYLPKPHFSLTAFTLHNQHDPRPISRRFVQFLLSGSQDSLVQLSFHHHDHNTDILPFLAPLPRTIKKLEISGRLEGSSEGITTILDACPNVDHLVLPCGRRCLLGLARSSLRPLTLRLEAVERNPMTEDDLAWLRRQNLRVEVGVAECVEDMLEEKALERLERLEVVGYANLEAWDGVQDVCK